MKPMDVWLVESDDYAPAQWGIVSSVEKGVWMMKAIYGPPYIVTWDEPVRHGEDEWSLTGHFKHVPDRCGDGPQTTFFKRFSLDALPQWLERSHLDISSDHEK